MVLFGIKEYIKKTIVIRKHRKMWKWLSTHPDKEKQDYLKIFDPKIHLQSNCYLCEYANGNCRYCPLDWPNEKCIRVSNGLYYRWARARSNKCYEIASKLALQIAKLPKRKGGKR